MGDVLTLTDDHDPLGHITEDEDSPRKLCPRFADDRFPSGLDELAYGRAKAARAGMARLLGEFCFKARAYAATLFDETEECEFFDDLDKLEIAHFGEIDRQLEAAEKLP